MNKYTHLNLHSEYSIQDGLIRINDLAEKASKLNFETSGDSEVRDYNHQLWMSIKDSLYVA